MNIEFDSFAFFTLHKFWLHKTGTDVSEERQFCEFPAQKKYLFLTFKLSKKEKKFLKEKYNIDRIFYFSNIKINIIRTIRFLLYKFRMKVPKKLLRPFKFSKKNKKSICEILKKLECDVCICEYIWYADILEYVHLENNITTIIETQDIQNKYYANLIKRGFRIKSFVDELEELSILNEFNKVIAISTNDYNYLLENGINKNKLVYLPTLLFDETNYRIIKKNNGSFSIGFIGGQATFNNEAITWFLKKVLPLFNSSDSLRPIINIYGGVCNTLSKDYEMDNVNFIGFVDSVDEVYKNNTIMINPTFQSGGIKTKNLESILNQTIILTTKIGAKGMEEATEYGLLYICNTPEEYYKKIIDISSHEFYFENIIDRSRNYLTKYFNKELYHNFIRNCR